MGLQFEAEIRHLCAALSVGLAHDSHPRLELQNQDTAAPLHHKCKLAGHAESLRFLQDESSARIRALEVC